MLVLLVLPPHTDALQHTPQQKNFPHFLQYGRLKAFTPLLETPGRVNLNYRAVLTLRAAA